MAKAKATPKKAVEKRDIKETKEVLALAFAIGKAFINAKKDNGEFDAGDIKHFIALFPVLSPALEGITNLPAELKDLDSDEIKELMTFAAAHLGTLFTDKEDLAAKIEEGLKLAIAITDFIKVMIPKK